ncbi:MAG TPA: Asp-tRNA(Asn)/Glu-tRNA(Gln) amidotransferase subunit GatB [Ktedonobacterales bacterium]|nr:Asp-tRNA(Asn)/Glu-tRNA(Gln) amidotransferase subunit GatB [Ktedonobacterales bacterium]
MSTVTAVDYEVIIGLEVHAQLLTASKMFCRCSASYADAAPNTHNCPICMGMPGVLPVINEQAVEYTVMTALALNCSIPSFSKFDRKNYFYPDLPKGYQISQYDIPLSRNGYLTITLKDEEKRVGIHRVHLEEDTGRLLHRVEPDGEAFSLVDLNRAGIPLMEIVSEPDMRSAEEARLYLQKLRAILVYLGVSSGRMEEGSLRCDANVSVRPLGETRLGTKTEIKNMNSFRAVQRALEYEAARQISILQAGGTITQETRGWVESKGVTVSQRSKEQAHDYRYFPEPDLPPLVLSQEWIEGVRAKMPELPDAKRQRFMEQYGLRAYDAEVLTAERALADYYEQAVAAAQGALPVRAKVVANWITGDLARLLNAAGQEITACPVTPAGLAKLVDLVVEERISGSQAKDVLEKSFASGQQPAEIVEAQGIAQISDQGELERIIDAVIADNPKAVEDFQRGKESSVTWLIGQVMKRSAGRAKPALVRALLLEKLHNQS